MPPGQKVSTIINVVLRMGAKTGDARFNERFLHWVELAVLREMLHGGHLRAVGEGRQIETARHGVTVHQDRAAAAQTLRAALPRAVQIELFAEHFDKAQMWLNSRLDGAAVQH